MKHGIAVWTVFFALGLGVLAGCGDANNTFGPSNGGGGGGGGGGTSGTIKIKLLTNGALGTYNTVALGAVPSGAMQGFSTGVVDTAATPNQPNSLDLPFHIVIGTPAILGPPPVAATQNISPTTNSYEIELDPNFVPLLPKTDFPTYGQMKTWTLHYDIATTIPLGDINSIAITWGPIGYPNSPNWPEDRATESRSWTSLQSVPLGTFVSCKAPPSYFIGGLLTPAPDGEPVNLLFEAVCSMRAPLQANGEIYFDNIYWSTN